MSSECVKQSSVSPSYLYGVPDALLFPYGKWQSSSSKLWGIVFNPSTGNTIARVPLCTADESIQAIDGAAAALDEWAETPVVERARSMFHNGALLQQNFDDLVTLATREHGTALAEAYAWVQRGIEIFEIAANCFLGDVSVTGACVS